MTAAARPLRDPVRRTARDRLLVPILVLGLLHGLVYLVVFPPWQHYDEPSHLEYVLLIARRGRLPASGEYDLATRRQIAASMAASDFYRGQAAPPIDFWSDSPPPIGVDELVHPPAYYLLLALAVRPLIHQAVEVQLYVARACSLLLFLVTLLAAYRLVAESFPRQPWLPAAVATFLALLPPFVDRMTSVNSDVGATAAATVLLWAAVAVARRGPSVARLLLVLGSAALCLATKSTAALVGIACGAALALSYLPRRCRRWFWSGACVLLAAALAALLAGRDRAAHWYSVDPDSASNRVEVFTPLDDSALLLAAQPAAGPRGIMQELPRAEGEALRGHTVTLGAWLRTAEGKEGRLLLSLDEGVSHHAWAVEATADWHLYTFTATIGLDARGVAVRADLPPGPAAAQEVYLDGVFLSDAVSAGGTPALAASDASRVLLEGREVPNLLRNGSARRVWPSIPAVVGERAAARSTVAALLYSILDGKRTAWVLPHEVRVLFKSFWGGFAWNQLELPGPAFYLPAAATLLAAAGAALGVARRRAAAGAWSGAGRRTWLLYAVALAAGWGMVILRVHPVFVTMRVWWPVARYADVVIVPVTVLLCGGLAELLPHRLRRAGGWIGLAGLLALDAASLGAVILPYYYG